MRKAFIAKAVFCFFVFIMFSVAVLFTFQNYKASLPPIVEIYSQSGVGVNADSVYLQNKRDIAFAAAMPTMAEINGNFIDINSVYTSAGYGAFARLKMIKGNYFSFDSFKMGERLCVISSNIETKYFSNISAIGNNILINNEEYKISGVYSTGENLLDKMSNSAVINIYISAPPSASRDAGFPINQVLINAQNDESLSAVLGNLQISTSIFFTGLTRNYSSHIALASSIIMIVVFLAALYPAILLLKLAINKIISIFGKVYLYSSRRILDIIKGIVPFFAGVLIIVGGFVSIKIPPEYLLSENIFDFTSYLNQIIAFYHNIYSGTFSSLSLYSANYLPAIAVLSLIAAGFFVLCIVFIRCYIKTSVLINGPKNDIIKSKLQL